MVGRLFVQQRAPREISKLGLQSLLAGVVRCKCYLSSFLFAFFPLIHGCVFLNLEFAGAFIGCRFFLSCARDEWTGKWVLPPSLHQSLVMHDMSVYNSAPCEDPAFIIMQLTRTMRAQVRIFTATQLRHSEMNRATNDGLVVSRTFVKIWSWSSIAKDRAA